ncbi:hypothetical protein H0A61_01539 [Koleobacter methoxysyntrophicus]|uniref:Polymerase nucleotidyl transferase domain-containing protein n=1 Tax=Koleobacter methoxysyntrophicus TaxID=2751313 RepID=A0A8A0RNL0_9FIRM|nr:nucleotidyltransferase domain-containing protein [Koleobacter methoxysyntrophicus]QSQ09180.1 hypothetical protein H0A61_01539 [Koleobacter methoxysyntrophicus]
MKVVFYGDKERKLLLEKELKRITEIIKRLDIKKAVLFGSCVKGDIGKNSDIDLLIIKDTEKRFLDRIDEIIRIIDPKVAVDILVYTPNEIEELLKVNSFIKEILKEGRVIHES